MEARAINRYIPTSPRKMRLVIDLIRGKSVDEALHILHFSPKHASIAAEKVLRSAISNLQNKDESGRIAPEDIVVKEVFVNGGMVMKRISPAPMGRAFRIRKRSNHITIVVAAKEQKKKAPKAPAKTQAGAPKAAASKTTSKVGGKSAKVKAAASAKKTAANKE